MRKYVILEVQETLFIHKHRDRKTFLKYFVGNFLFAVARDKLCVQLSEAVEQLQRSPLLWWNLLLGCFHKTHLPGNTGTSISSFPLSVFVGRFFFVLMERGTFFLFLILLLSLKLKHTICGSSQIFAGEAGHRLLPWCLRCWQFPAHAKCFTKWRVWHLYPKACLAGEILPVRHPVLVERWQVFLGGWTQQQRDIRAAWRQERNGCKCWASSHVLKTVTGELRHVLLWWLKAMPACLLCWMLLLAIESGPEHVWAPQLAPVQFNLSLNLCRAVWIA